jgi:cytoskeletal protein CcmA (bactofilin family)
MWRSKKPDERQAAKAELKNLQGNQLSGPPAAGLQGSTQVSKEAVGPTGTRVGRVAARLSENLRVKGEITGSEDLVIEGTFEGLAQLGDTKLTIGTTAKVTADIIAGEVVVYGKVNGNVRAKDRIEIKRDGSVIGDLTTPQIFIEDGAFFKGSIEIKKSVEQEADRNVFPPAA